MKTTNELTALKKNWITDPCWDIEETEGFEEHHDDLLAWRIEYERLQNEREERRIQEKADDLKCSVETARLIDYLEFRIGRLERQ